MSNKTAIIDLLQSNQEGKENTQNILNNAFAPSALFAKRDKTTAALTWGYYGGRILFGTLSVNYDNGTFLLADNTTSYIQLNHDTKLLEVNTVGFTDDGLHTPVYSVITQSGTVFDWTDFRTFLKIAGTDSYTLPTASTTVKGGVKVDGTTITADSNGVISAVAGGYTLPKATTSVLGGVKPDGTTITVDSNGVISSAASYTLPKATTSVLGGVKADGTTITVDSNGVISSVSGSYTLPTASTTTKGGVLIDGTTVTIDGSGRISATQYSLPTASTTVLGGVKVDGTSITISGGVISAASGTATLTTNRVFSPKSVSGLVVTVYGGRALNIGSTGFYNSSINIKTIADTAITLPANSSGYIVYRNASGGSLTSVTTANVYNTTQKPLYYYVTNASSVTTLEWVGDSFVNFNMFNPVQELVKTSWAVSTSYGFAMGFSDINSTGTSWNILPRRVMLQCTTAELGYSVGHMATCATFEPGVVVEQGNVRIITQKTLPQILNRTAGSVGALATVTAANWKIVLVVESIM